MRKRVHSLIAFILCMAAVIVMLPLAAHAEGGKLLAITFDDGPSKHTGRLLTALKERNAKATFFIIANRAVTFYDEIERMYDEGHQIASHTYSHKYLTKVSSSEAKREIANANNYLAPAAGGNKIYLRAPGGMVNATVKSVSGAPIIGWAVDPKDWQIKNADKVCSNIVNAAKDGDIILVHDLYSTSVDGAIKAIDILQKRGYEFVTVQELFRRRGVNPKNGEVYSSAPNKGTNLPAEADNTIYTGALADHPDYEYIKRVMNEGIYTVAGGGQFAPNKPITRGMFATMLGRLEGIKKRDTNTGYGDVPSDLYQSAYIKWVSDNNIMSGYGGGKFAPGDTMTRADMITCLMRYIKYKGFSTAGYVVPEYEDASYVVGYAKGNIDFFKYAGILEKSECADARGDETATKAEAAKLICRTADFVADGDSYIKTNGMAFDYERTEVVDAVTAETGRFFGAIFALAGVGLISTYGSVKIARGARRRRGEKIRQERAEKKTANMPKDEDN